MPPYGSLARVLLPAVCLVALCFASAAAAIPPDAPRLIFDTDMGNDVDDAFALAMMHALQSRGECEIVAVVLSKDNEYAGPFCDLVNTWYGRPDIPIGVVRGGKTPDDSRYIRELATAKDGGRLRYPHRLASGKDAPEAVGLLRKVLAKQRDGSVVFVATGFSTNLARLLESSPDSASALTGRDLVARKARLLSIMAGDYRAVDAIPEYNVATDPPAAARVFADWPTPIVASGYEVGLAVEYPAASMAHDFGYVRHHPIWEASYLFHGEKVSGRPAWDCTSVLYAVRPDRGYFGLSPAGAIAVGSDSRTAFKPSEGGARRYLTVTPEQIAAAREAVVELTSQPPAR